MAATRRTFLSWIAAGIATGVPQLAFAEEPFPVFKSDPEKLPYRLRKREVEYKTSEAAGTIIVDTQRFFLYYVLPGNRAIRYGIGVGRKGSRWTGEAKINRKSEWPTWTPTGEMLERHENYAQWKKRHARRPGQSTGCARHVLAQ